MWTLSIIVGYLLAGLLIHHWILPSKTPDYSDYFKVGKSFHSKLEGLSQKVVDVKNGNLITDIEIQPKSAGPVTHIHEKFDESFTVKSGTLSIQYGTEIKKITTGQTIVIPKNNSKPPKILFQLAVFGDKFDSYPTVDAPPKPVLKTLKFLLAPTARLMGYKNYNQKYQLK